MKKLGLGILVVGLVLTGFFAFGGKLPEKLSAEGRYEIHKKWELPKELKEISGIAWIEDKRIACIQDEDGIIFVYNLESSKVESKVAFSEGGDYEGIAVINDNAYVLRSDGVIFEVTGFTGEDPKVRKYLTETNQLPGINIEGLCADPVNDRLLLAVKKRKGVVDQKEIYSFNLQKKESEGKPLFVVELTDPIFSKINEKLERRFEPGEIGMHPQTGEYYILDGTRPKLLITRSDGSLKELFLLRSREFGNPEGLTFSPEGDLYISNEAEGAPANILLLSLNR